MYSVTMPNVSVALYIVQCGNMGTLAMYNMAMYIVAVRSVALVANCCEVMGSVTL